MEWFILEQNEISGPFSTVEVEALIAVKDCLILVNPPISEAIATRTEYTKKISKSK